MEKQKITITVSGEQKTGKSMIIHKLLRVIKELKIDVGVEKDLFDTPFIISDEKLSDALKSISENTEIIFSRKTIYPIIKEEEKIKYPHLDRTYYHYKGGSYSIITLAHDKKTNEDVVVYKSNEFGTVYVRPLKEWSEIVVPPNENYVNGRKRFLTASEF